MYLLILSVLVPVACAPARTLEVKQGRSAIVKVAPTADAKHLTRLPAGTRVEHIGDAPRYYSIRLADGTIGWSYKGHFIDVDTGDESAGTPPPPTKESLQARSDVLKIIVIDVEVGDATLIICPEENGERDVILIDTGVNDSDRIRAELIANGFTLSGKPITRFIITHYDTDHFGHAAQIVPLSKVVYDHGDNIKTNFKKDYQALVNKPGIDRRLMTLDYEETFTGGVTIECVAVNQATDFEPNLAPSPPESDNANSIALIVTYGSFDYFTGGDLTKKPEKSLGNGGIRNVDVYHVDHHGSSSTSSPIEFVRVLDPEVSIVSNGTSHGHPTDEVAQRLLGLDSGNRFFQTNINPDSRAHHPEPKFVADDTLHEDSEDENAEGATGTIRLIVDLEADKYYVVMPGLSLSEGTFPIE